MQVFTNDEFFKLPKWAQLKVTQLTNALEVHEKVRANETESPVYINKYTGNAQKKFYLPKADITFVIGDQRYDIGIRDHDTHEPYLNVASNDAVSIVPSATNCFRVRLGKY